MSKDLDCGRIGAATVRSLTGTPRINRPPESSKPDTCGQPISVRAEGERDASL